MSSCVLTVQKRMIKNRTLRLREVEWEEFKLLLGKKINKAIKAIREITRHNLKSNKVRQRIQFNLQNFMISFNCQQIDLLILLWLVKYSLLESHKNESFKRTGIRWAAKQFKKLGQQIKRILTKGKILVKQRLVEKLCLTHNLVEEQEKFQVSNLVLKIWKTI